MQATTALPTPPALADNLPAMAMIVLAMAVIAGLEAILPLRERTQWNRAHLRPNLTLMAITFATNVFFNTALVTMLAWMEAEGVGLANWLRLGVVPTLIVTVVGLEFAWYLTHVSMHRFETLWRFHRVHHSDLALDVTTTIRQHPGEGVIRYAFLAAFALVLGATPAAFVVYRVWSALNGLLEHANIRLPLWLDQAMALVSVSPNYHKVHHSRHVAETDSNYGNILSVFDRLFATYTPAARGLHIEYGLAGHDGAAIQTTRGLLSLPFVAQMSGEVSQKNAPMQDLTPISG
ncbi:MAG TPA: sterol desaturase family protein [Candidatus Binatia bacterium]|nr:sterol desaturase family protein [Candidatus Binatia bacterium]